MPELAIKDMTNAQKKDEIAATLRRLQRETDDTGKRKLRQRLRLLGHTGGLGLGRGAKPKAKDGGKKKGKRAKKPATEPAMASV